MVLAVHERLKEAMLQTVDENDENLQAVTTQLMLRLWFDLPNELREAMSADSRCS